MPSIKKPSKPKTSDNSTGKIAVTPAPASGAASRKQEALEADKKLKTLVSDRRRNLFEIAVVLVQIHDRHLWAELGAASWKDYVEENTDFGLAQANKWRVVGAHFTEDQVAQVGDEVLYLYANHCLNTKTPIATDLSTVTVDTKSGKKPLTQLSKREAEAAFPHEHHTPRKPSSSGASGEFGGWETWADQGGLGPAHTYAAVIANTVRDEGVAPIIEARPGKDGTRLVIDIEMRRFPDLVRAFAAHLKEFGVPDLKKDSADVRIPKLKDATPKGTPAPKPAPRPTKSPAKKKAAEKR